MTMNEHVLWKAPWVIISLLRSVVYLHGILTGSDSFKFANKPTALLLGWLLQHTVEPQAAAFYWKLLLRLCIEPAQLQTTERHKREHCLAAKEDGV